MWFLDFTRSAGGELRRGRLPGHRHTARVSWCQLEDGLLCHSAPCTCCSHFHDGKLRFKAPILYGKLCFFLIFWKSKTLFVIIFAFSHHNPSKRTTKLFLDLWEKVKTQNRSLRSVFACSTATEVVEIKTVLRFSGRLRHVQLPWTGDFGFWHFHSS